MSLSTQTIDALAVVISGGRGNGVGPPIGLYRTAAQIEAFMRALGVRMEIGSGSRVPTLTAVLEDLVLSGDMTTLARAIEGAVAPADFLDDPARGQAVVEYLNQRLAFDDLVLRWRDKGYELVDQRANAPVISALSQALVPIDFDTVTRDLNRSLNNAEQDPEDAVTSACAVIESVCRSIIVELGADLPAKRDVQSLFRVVRDELGLDPNGHFRDDIADDVKRTLGGLSGCIMGIGALRTHGGDAHGRERGYGRSIDARIARLAIHSASAMALFLIETWQLKHPGRLLHDVSEAAE